MRLVFLAALLIPLAAAAQDPTRHSIEIAAVGRQTANESNYVYGPPSGPAFVVHQQLFGGALAGYSYALTPNLALEVRAGYLFGRQIQVPQDGGEQIMAHAGLRATVPLGRSRFAFRARIAPGIASFSSGLRDTNVQFVAVDPSGSIFQVQGTPYYSRITHFSLEESAGISTRLSARTFFNVDVSHEILLQGDRSYVVPQLGDRQILQSASVEDHVLVTAGLSRSFGRAFQPPSPPAEHPTSPANELVVSYALQPTVHLEFKDLGLDNGFAFTGSHFLRNWLALDTSIIVLPHGDTLNYQDGGVQTQLLAGLRFGIRRPRYGVFGKLRPGLIVYSNTYNTGQPGDTPTVANDFGGDLGAVFELYPARHLVLRFDLGETLVRYSAVDVVFPPTSAAFPGGSMHLPAANADSPQFLIGAGWRF